MKGKPSGSRSYDMTARAAAAAATERRLVEAAIRKFGARLYDEVTLEELAEDAGVTVKTLLRKFGSKEGLALAAAEVGAEQVRAERSDVPVGDVEAAIDNLMEHYETWGERSLLFLQQEERIEAVARATAVGRELHHAWVDHVFAPQLRAHRGAARKRVRAQLIASTDVYVWKIVRRDLGMDRRAAHRTILELVRAILNRE